MHQSRNYVTILKIKIVKRTENVGGNDTCKAISVLVIHASKIIVLLVTLYILLVLNVNHPFCVSITEVGLVWWAVMNHVFVNRISCFVWKDAGRQAGN